MTDTVGFGDLGGVGALWPIEGSWPQTNPSFFNFTKRTAVIGDVVQSSLDKISGEKDSSERNIEAAIAALQHVRLSFIHVLVLRIVKFVVKIFNEKYNKIDHLLTTDHLSSLLIRKYTQILSPRVADYSPLGEFTVHGDINLSSLVQIGLYELQRHQFSQLKEILDAFKKDVNSESLTPDERLKSFDHLPDYLKKILQTLANTQHEVSVRDNPKILTEEIADQSSILEQLDQVFSSQVESYQALTQLEGEGSVKISEEQRESLFALIQANDEVLGELSNERNFDDKHCVYDVSVERLMSEIPKSILEKPITVTMVGVEYAGLIKQGGLAEALEGLSRGVKKQNRANRVNLIFPKYSHLPEHITKKMEEPTVHVNSKGEEYRVYTHEIDGVSCCFIEHPSFELEKERPNVYGPDYTAQATRFAAFSELAADLIYERKDSDIIHLHDWHVSGVALKLKNEHKTEWENGDIPPILFTFHNNNRVAQGRIMVGSHPYDPVVKGYQDCGIIRENNENLFVQTLRTVDAVTTVSETFGMEAQQADLGEGVSFAVRRAAEVGKLTGIINGANPDRWNPKTDQTLKNWKNVVTQERVDLSYGPDHEDLIGQRGKCKKQLQKWVNKYLPDTKIDFSKPIVTYIGRFDSYQKGLDKFEEAIESTLKNGGQFICMGSGEDPEAKDILDSLQEKYKQGVLFIRDYKDQKGRYYYQQGDSNRPGIGPLVRAASDFLFIPSRFEPCGLVQFEGWLFGSLAIGSETGGLADTIISQEADPEQFNGFLFRRNGSRASQVGRVIGRALKFWAEQSSEQKESTIKRIMEEGRQYGWTESPSSFAPVEKYRFAYANAQRRVKWRKASSQGHHRIELIRHRILRTSKYPAASLEEAYLSQYYKQQGLDSESLNALYRKLPEGMRQQLPSPYGVNVHHTKYEDYGAFPTDGGTTFSVLVPNAKKVVVVLADENENIQGEHLMKRDQLGKWVATIPGVGAGQKYQFKIDGNIKIDPYGRWHKPSKYPGKEPYSVVVASDHQWSDNLWMRKKERTAGKSQPMSIYELHPTTWKRRKGAPLNYRELAKELVNHCRELGYTHIELMGILEHPDERSWGYQVSGYFAPNSRLGSVDDFKFMMDYLHKNDIGVILDWIPAHFATDKYGLSEFDGSKLYEASGFKYFFGIRKNFFKFGSKHFDYTKKEVREFLISSAFFWLKEMHIDGLRVDCVRSVLNAEDKESAFLFIRDLNAVIHNKAVGSFTIAEEHSGDIRITSPSYQDGFDFDMKWHVGWMHHMLGYFTSSLESRRRNYKEIADAIMCDNFHKQVMFLSHDEVKDSVRTLINKTPNIHDQDTKYANVRAMLSFMMCSPGKKLQFMGSERGNDTPWNHFIGKKEKGLLDEIDMGQKGRKGLMRMIARLNTIYKTKSAFYERDNNGKDIEWICDPNNRVHAYRRQSSDGSSYSCLHNFTGRETRRFTVTVPKKEGRVISPEEIFNTDDSNFDGQGRLNHQIKIEENEHEIKYTVQIPPLATVIIKEVECV